MAAAQSPPTQPDPPPVLPPVLPWELPRFRNWIAVAKVHALVEKAMVQALAPLDVKLPHYDILANIYRFPGLTQQELANRLLVGRSNLSMLLPELERRGLVERVADDKDKRVRRLQLTAQGMALTTRAVQVQVNVIDGMLHILSADECEQLGDLMRRVGVALGERVRGATDGGGG